MGLLKTEKGEKIGLPKGWIRETYSRKKQRGGGAVYFVWIAPDKTKYRSQKQVDMVLNGEDVMETTTPSKKKTPKRTSKKKKRAPTPPPLQETRILAKDFVLPKGWTSKEHTRGNGQTFRTFMSPSGVKHRSMTSVIRAIESSTSVAQERKESRKKKKKKRVSAVETIWVQCDKVNCGKWRQIAKPGPGENLPIKWYCRLNTFDSSYASCDVPEDHSHEEDGNVAVSTAIATFQRGVFTRALRVRILCGDSSQKRRNEENQQSLTTILDSMQPIKPLPPGWSAVEHIRNSGGKKYFHFIAPDGSSHRSYVYRLSLSLSLSLVYTNSPNKRNTPTCRYAAMERYLEAQEKKKKKKKKKDAEVKKKTMTITLKMNPPQRKRRREPVPEPVPVDPWMILSDADEEDDTKVDPYAAQPDELLVEEMDTETKEEEEEEKEEEEVENGYLHRRRLRARPESTQQPQQVVPYARRLACVPSPLFNAGRLLSDCSTVWTFAKNFQDLLRWNNRETFESFSRKLASPKPQPDIMNLFQSLLNVLLLDRDSNFQDSEPMWTVGPEQSIVSSLVDAPDRFIKIETNTIICKNNKWSKDIPVLDMGNIEDGFVDVIMLDEFQSNYFKPKRLLPAEGSAVGMFFVVVYLLHTHTHTHTLSHSRT